jgi:type VI secretion system protein ImpG
VYVDHKKGERLITPLNHEGLKIAIHEVIKVQSVTKDGKQKTYVPFETSPKATPGVGRYSVRTIRSPVSGKIEHYLRLVYDAPNYESLNYNSPFSEGMVSEAAMGRLLPETLSLSLSCHNMGLSDQLRTGEIREPTDSSPAAASFRNIIPPSSFSPGIRDDERRWKLLSHIHVNLFPRLTADSLKEILLLRLPGTDPDAGRGLANQKRIDAITHLKVYPEDYFVMGRPMRGQRVEIEADVGGFGSMGDLHVFGGVLDFFLGLFHHINTYVRLVIIEKNSKERLSWPPRLGARRLI